MHRHVIIISSYIILFIKILSAISHTHFMPQNFHEKVDWFPAELKSSWSASFTCTSQFIRWGVDSIFPGNFSHLQPAIWIHQNSQVSFKLLFHLKITLCKRIWTEISKDSVEETLVMMIVQTSVYGRKSVTTKQAIFWRINESWVGSSWNQWNHYQM